MIRKFGRFIMLVGIFLPSPVYSAPMCYDITGDQQKELVRAEIIYQAYKNKISIPKAIQIAECESGFDSYAKNPNSSARGVYQFIDATWNAYCQGDRTDYKDNIACFMEFYPKYPQWWKDCK